jgi:hypothetical protein
MSFEYIHHNVRWNIDVFFHESIRRNGRNTRYRFRSCLLHCSSRSLVSIKNRKSANNPSRTFFGMRMKNMNILSKNVMCYGHILRQDLMPYGELKFLNFLFYRLIFLLMRLNFYLSVSVIKELFQFFFQFYLQNHSTFNKNAYLHFFVTHANIQALFLSKKAMRYGHILSSSLDKRLNKKVRLGNSF